MGNLPGGVGIFRGGIFKGILSGEELFGEEIFLESSYMCISGKKTLGPIKLNMFNEEHKTSQNRRRSSTYLLSITSKY